MTIGTAVTALRPTIEKLAEFAALKRDWDSYGGLPASPRAVSGATELLILLADRLAHLPPEAIIPYTVAPIADGGIQLEWHGREREIEVDIGPSGALGYLVIEGQGDQRRFHEQSDVSLESALSQIDSALA
jgi:hypothetical protein